MIKLYNEFYCGKNKLKIGQSYFADGKRMKLLEIRNGRYIFIKGDDIINIPEDKLYRYVSENKIILKHIKLFEI